MIKKHAGSLADLLTLSRAILGLSIALIGVVGGIEALPLAVMVLILAWLTDFFDGKVARQNPERAPSWIAAHDAEADLMVGLGAIGYLVTTGYLALWIGLALALTTAVIWHVFSYHLAWPFYAVSYLLLFFVVWKQQPALLWAIGAYLLFVLIVNWRRARDEYLPGFFGTLAGIFKK